MEKIRTKAILLTAFILSLLVAFFFMNIVQDKQRLLDEKDQAHRMQIDNSYKLAVLDIEKGLYRYASDILINHDAINAFQSRDRNTLYRTTLPYYTKAKQAGDVDLTGFFLPDGTSFLRIQEPKKFGDNIAKKRPMLALALKEKRAIISMDVTIYNISLVSIIPIFNQGRFLGVIQVSSKIERLQNRLNLHSDIKSALAFDTKKIHALLPASSFKEYGGYAIIASNDKLFDNLPSNYHFQNSLRHTVGDKTFIFIAKDIQTYDQKPIAKIICSFDITQDEKNYRNALLQLSIVTILLTVTGVIILYIGFTLLIRRINEDIKIKEELNEQLSHQLYVDHLTGYPNRHALLKDIQEESFYAIILLNINNFKEINDFYGHEIGDQVLVSITNTIQDEINKYPMRLYKMPSDEYALALLKPMSGHESESISQSILHDIQTTHYDFSGIHIHITLTMGINIFIQGSNNEPSALLIHADMALKEAKKRHKSHLLYNENMQIKQEYHNNILWSKKVNDAIDEDRFTLYYQPIYDAAGSIVEYEALIRMIESDHTVVSPYYFLQAAKRSNLYPHLTKFVISSAFSFIEATQSNVSINFSVEDILDTPTREFLLHKLQNCINSKQLIIELLESDGIDNYPEVSSFIKQVKQYGVRIAIDDFGTGYSNFAHILRLNVDLLKIDGSLIKNIDTDTNAQTIVTAIVHFSQQLGLKTVAEFVHTESVYAMCRKLNVDYFQGYYLSEPKPLKELSI